MQQAMKYWNTRRSSFYRAAASSSPILLSSPTTPSAIYIFRITAPWDGSCTRWIEVTTKIFGFNLGFLFYVLPLGQQHASMSIFTCPVGVRHLITAKFLPPSCAWGWTTWGIPAHVRHCDVVSAPMSMCAQVTSSFFRQWNVDIPSRIGSIITNNTIFSCQKIGPYWRNWRDFSMFSNISGNVWHSFFEGWYAQEMCDKVFVWLFLYGKE